MFEKGEGLLFVTKISEDEIEISYSCVDDYCFKVINTDQLMKMLGYE